MSLYVLAEEGEQGLGLVVRKATDAEIIAAVLANGERVWWCVDIGVGYLESLNCYTPRNAPELHNGCGWRLLVDHPTEED